MCIREMDEKVYFSVQKTCSNQGKTDARTFLDSYENNDFDIMATCKGYKNFRMKEHVQIPRLLSTQKKTPRLLNIDMVPFGLINITVHSQGLTTYVPN